MINPLRNWLTKNVLKNAMVIENRLLKSYENIIEEIGKKTGRKDLNVLIQSEKTHIELLKQIKQKDFSFNRIKALLEQNCPHNADKIKPLDDKLLTSYREKLEEIENLEHDTFVFYSNLNRMSKIPAVKEAFRFLAQQENIHLQIIKKLLGK